MTSLQLRMGPAWTAQERWQKLSGTFVILGRLRDASAPEQSSFCRIWKTNGFVDLPWPSTGGKRIFWIEFLGATDIPPPDVEPVPTAKGLWSCTSEARGNSAADYLPISTSQGLSNLEQRDFLRQEITLRLKGLLK